MNLNEGLKKNPLLRILIPFIVAIAVGSSFRSFFLTHLSFIMFILLLSTFSFLVIIILLLKLRLKLTDFLITTIVFILSLMHTLMFMTSGFAKSDKNTYMAVVTDLPEFKTNSTLIKVKLKRNDKPILYAPHVYLYTDKDSGVIQSVKPGQYIIFKTRLQAVKNHGNPDEFDYSSYMFAHGVFYQAYIPTDSLFIVKESDKRSQFISCINSIRSYVNNLIDDSFDNEDVQGVLKALVIGDRTGLSHDLRSKYADAGVVHVLAISGLHVGILYMLLLFLLKPFEDSGKLRLIRFVIVVVVIWSFALITGFSSSVARAAVLFTLLCAGTTLNREISGINLLAASAFILLLINPFSLYDVGFQLSFAAVTGILLFQPVFYKRFRTSNKVLDYFYQLFTVSIAAQLTTTPLTIYYFNQFPVWFWFSNLIVVPLIFLILMLCILFLITAKVFFLGFVFSTLIQWGVIFINYFIMIIKQLPYSVLEKLYLSKAEVILAYILIFISFYWLTLKNRKLILPFFLCIFLYFVVNLVDTNSKGNKEKLIIYNIKNELNIGLYLKGRNLLYTSDISDVKRNVEYYYSKHWLKMKRKQVQIFPLDSLLKTNFDDNARLKNFELTINKNFRFIFFSDGEISKLKCGNSIENYLIICNNIYPPDTCLSKFSLILPASLDYYYAIYWHDFAKKNNLQCYDIKINGAFEKNLNH